MKFHNCSFGTLYIGVTSDLIKRVYEHKNDLVDGFTKRYKVHNLIWYEAHETAESAIKREKNIKKWERSWKLKLIENWNPEWNDLYCSICEDTGFPLNGLRERRLNKQTLTIYPQEYRKNHYLLICQNLQ
ncbi:MAG: GIY-YIG nuclease family protein [Nitrospirae bacterium]|nr:GIY-YIG nuclease family protein [Nitrospirota bacterium]